MTDMTESLRAALDNWSPSYGGVPAIEEVVLHQALATALARLEAAERNHVERKHIDATPNDNYPLRILRAYRADCDMRWAKTTDGKNDTPLVVALNEMQDERAAILDRAIAALAAGESGT